MLGYRYLSDKQLQGFNVYKYSCIETNPLTIYFFQPWWRTVVKVVPLWVAPNLLTLIGFLLHFSIFLIFSCYDYYYNVTGNPHYTPIPTWVWLYAGVAHFTAHTLDGIDGKQARRTNSSSPLGELFDHGLDSLVCIFIPLILYSIVGRSRWGCTPIEGYWTAAALMIGFYLSHWEKYITGTIYLPWAYDTGELAIPIFYIITGTFGIELWQFKIIPGYSFTAADTFRYAILIGCIFSLPTITYNIMMYFKSTSSYADRSTVSVSTTIVNSSPSSTSSSSTKTDTRGFTELSFPLLPVIIVFTIFTLWAYTSPSNVIDKDPRAFAVTAGLVFSNAVCRLIVSQMSGACPDYFSVLSVPVVMAMGISFYLPQYELIILYGLLVVVLSAHVHYGCSVVNELCHHFNIYAFSLKKIPPH